MKRIAVCLSALIALAGCTSHQPASPHPNRALSSSPAPSAPLPSRTPAATDVSSLPIRYLIAPHPDDEFAIWSMAQDPTHFPVPIVLAHGERSGPCSGDGWPAG